MTDIQKQFIEKEAQRLEGKYGHRAGSTAATEYDYDVIPTGIMALDYALGTGGWPRGQIYEVFGIPDIGKSSLLGLSAIHQAQKLGLLCGIVALEPQIDRKWLIKNGVDPELVVVGRPDNGEDAFEMTFDWTTSGAIDFILFDSVGAVLSRTEAEEDGKAKMGGQSGLITWGVKRLLMPAWKNNVGIMMINQVRADMNSRMPGVLDSPGGHALKHSSGIRVQLRPGKDKFNVKENGEDVLAGREVVAVVKRNKNTEGTGHKAIFKYFHKETDQYPFGIDIVEDVIATGTATGVIKGVGWYEHHLFPVTKKGEHKVQGKAGIAKFLEDNPQSVDVIRREVLEVMSRNQAKARATKTKLEVVGG